MINYKRKLPGMLARLNVPPYMQGRLYHYQINSLLEDHKEYMTFMAKMRGL